MGMFVWVIMGIAVWHFAIFVPDRFYGGIVGAFAAAVVGAALFGFLVSGLTIPGIDDTDLVTAVVGVPGTVLGLAVSYWYGVRTETDRRPDVL